MHVLYNNIIIYIEPQNLYCFKLHSKQAVNHPEDFALAVTGTNLKTPLPKA